MDIYENIIVGNFLFGLGVKLGMQHHALPVEPVSVNLLQQQKLDERLGDVVIANSHLVRLIEFKRSINKDGKEERKWKKLSTALEVKNIAGLREISRKIHWYIDSDFRQKKIISGNFGIKVCPYLDFTNPSSQISLTDFIDVTAESANIDKPSSQEILLCRMYIEMIAGVFGDSSGVSGCLLLTIDGSGQMSYIAVDDIGDLIKTPQLVLEQHLKRELELVRVREQRLEHEQLERIREQRIERSGPSLSR